MLYDLDTMFGHITLIIINIIIIMHDSIKNKDLNCKCVCGRLYVKPIELAMTLPCEHIFHLSCLNKNKYKFCPICDTEIDGIHRMTKKIKTYTDVQRYSDMLSVSNYCGSSDYSIASVIDNTMDLSHVLLNIPFCKNLQDGRKVVDNFLSLNNTDICVRGLDRFNPREEKVFICNHTSYMDFMIIARFIDTYFLASEFVTQSALGTMITKIMPLMIFSRGKSNNVVEQMKKFVKKHGSICLFPEGVMSHPDTIVKFRTGAFHIGAPIYPIVLRYENIKSDFDITTFILKSSTRDKVKIYMDVIGPYYPPFSEEKIEKIREDMASVGDMLTSRVSSRGITEKDN